METKELEDYLISKGAKVFHCNYCAEIFDKEVWHCVLCDHHWTDDYTHCHNCCAINFWKHDFSKICQECFAEYAQENTHTCKDCEELIEEIGTELSNEKVSYIMAKLKPLSKTESNNN